MDSWQHSSNWGSFDVSLADVPEPATAGVLLAGGLLLVGRRHATARRC
jgi:hypothetical protein